MVTMKDWEVLKKDLLKNKEVAREYQRLEPKYALISTLIEARLKKGLTQGKLAQKIGTKQSAIARFESGTTNPTYDFLEKIASALGTKITVGV